MQEVVDAIAPGSQPYVTDTGKIVYANPQMRKQVVYDIEGNYFRIQDLNLSGKRVYLDINGNVVPNNILVNAYYKIKNYCNDLINPLGYPEIKLNTVDKNEDIIQF